MSTFMREVAVGIVVGVSVFLSCWLAYPAKADPVDQLATAICGALYGNPVPSEVWDVGQFLIAQGLTPTDAARLVSASVAAYCPVNQYLIDEYKNSGQPMGGASLA